jgi:hypothetical protein
MDGKRKSCRDISWIILTGFFWLVLGGVCVARCVLQAWLGLACAAYTYMVNFPLRKETLRIPLGFCAFSLLVIDYSLIIFQHGREKENKLREKETRKKSRSKRIRYCFEYTVTCIECLALLLYILYKQDNLDDVT